MNSVNRFCRQCGNPIAPGAAFCQVCGTAATGVNDKAPVYPPAVPVASAGRTTRRRPSIILLLIGLVLILLALNAPAALLFGISASGVITDVRQIVDSSSDRMDYNYRVTYAFTTPDGKRHTGSYDMNKIYNVANLPAEGSLKTVKYLPGLPFVNCVAGQNMVGLSAVLMIALGVFLFFIGVKGGGSITFRRRRR